MKSFSANVEPGGYELDEQAAAAALSALIWRRWSYFRARRLQECEHSSGLATHLIVFDRGDLIVFDRGDVSTPRFLKADDKLSDSIPSQSEERDIGGVKVFGIVAKALRAKAKLTIILGRGFSPVKAAKKLQVTSLKDKNFKSFARYYARYLAKYPQKAKSLPATAEDVIETGVIDTKNYMNLYMKDADDAIILAKLKEWLKQRVFPQQIAQKLGDIGLTDNKYAQLYVTMWGENQARLFAKANK
ncbi:hypothetical protein GQ600_23135 [Phytophthora cactorum]|nr:hypothetical protein GQ600_23135 [Phytophthora cactorum]